MNAPIFIGGCGRSGTTLLRVILNSHSRIYCGSELRLTPAFCQLYQEIANHPNIGSYGWDLSNLKLLFSNLYLSFFQRIDLNEGVCRVAEKTPGNVKHFEILNQIFPQSPLIHIIRDGRDVIASYLSQNWVDLQTMKPMDLTQDPALAAEQWLTAITLHEQYLQLKLPNYFVIRYEELLDKPEDRIRELLNFCQEDYEEDVLNFHRKKHNLDVDASATQVSKPLYKTSIGKWKSKLSSEQLSIIAPIIGSKLVELGYCSNEDWRKW